MTTLINADEAKSRFAEKEKLYLDGRADKVSQSIERDLKIIDSRIKLATNNIKKGIHYVCDEECQEELTKILTDYGYAVDCRFMGGGRVRLIITW